MIIITLFLLLNICGIGYGKIDQHQIFKKYDRVTKLIKSGEWKQIIAKSRNTGNETLYDWYDDFYNINVTIGTPPQTLCLALDTNSAVTWVIDSKCYTDYCVGWTITDYDKNQYFTFNTTTYRNTSRLFSVKYANGDEASGWVASDVFKFSGFNLSRAEFGLAEAVNEHVGFEPIDGYFGVGWPIYDVDGMTPPIWNITDQMDQQMFTIWLDRHPGFLEYGSNGGQITIGGLDIQNCNKNFNWVPLNTAGKWEFKLDSFSISSYTDSKTVAAISDVGKSFIGAPYWALNKVEKFTYASYDLEQDIYFVHCNRTGLPDLIFTIGGMEYRVPQEEYILDLNMSNGMCVLAVYELKFNGFSPTWILGDSFIRSYCQAYDMQNQRVGFSTAHHSQIL
uniref:Peptidase A1 domain-containing protein n=1 Tax=Panagrolaimus sp. ES5 TaxID=591445 RepID=A0AC34GS67_9BILA